VYYRVGGYKVSRGTLPSGDAGTRKTLGLMRQLALDGARQPEVQAAAVSIVRQAGAPPHDHMAELIALYRFVRDQVRFTDDPVNVEKLQGPRYTLEVLSGDCDDRATLLASLARSIGIPADLRFRVVAANPRNRAYSHVYVMARLRGRDIALDPTYPENQPGREYSRGSRVGDYRV